MDRISQQRYGPAEDASRDPFACRLGRRTVLKGAVAAALVGWGPATAGGVEQGAGEWPSFQRDAANSGFAPNASPPDDAATVWQRTSLRLQKGVTPTVAGGTVYLPYRREGGSSVLGAFAAADGSERWDEPFATDEDFSLGTPAVADGRVIVAGHGDAGKVYALDADDGSLAWTFEPDGDPTTDPNAVGGTAFVASGGNVHALDVADGSPRWTATVPADHDPFVVTVGPPPVTSDRVFVHVGRTTYALDRGDGSQVWSASYGELDSALAVAGGTVFATAYEDREGGLYALDAADGSIEWSANWSGGFTSPLTVAGGRVYFTLTEKMGTEDWPNALYAYDAGSGDRLWANETVGRIEEVGSTPVVAGDAVLVGDITGTVYAIAADSGAVRWQHDVGGAVVPFPVAAGDRVYVAGGPNAAAMPDDGKLVALGGGETNWSVVEVESTDEDRAFYEFTVTGDLELGEKADPVNAEYPDEVNGRTGSGSVANFGADSFRFTGETEAVAVDGPADVYVDGERIDVGGDLPREIEVVSTGDDRAFYEFTVTGDLEPGERANTVAAEYPDQVSGRTGSGSVAKRGADNFYFSGELEDVEVNGPADVYVDGEQIDVGGGNPTRELRVVSTGDDRAFYEFTVDGALELGEDANPVNAEYPDEVDGRTGSGSVALGGSDNFYFSGDLVDLTVDGPAEVLVDGEEVDPESVGFAGTGERADGSALGDGGRR